MRLMSDRAYAYAYGDCTYTVFGPRDRAISIFSTLSVEILGEPRACIDLDIEKREGESLELYMRSVPLTTSPASGQLYIYMQHPDWTGASPVPSPDTSPQSSPVQSPGPARSRPLTSLPSGLVETLGYSFKVHWLYETSLFEFTTSTTSLPNSARRLSNLPATHQSFNFLPN